MNNIAKPDTRFHPYDLFGVRMKKLIGAHMSNTLDYKTFSDATTSIYWELLTLGDLNKIPKDDYQFFNSLHWDIGRARFGEQPDDPLTKERLGEGLARAEKLIRYYVDFGIKY